ncbi:peptidase domain-containing ABC transporter [Anabaena cylindrica FACHB-243]|uniref:Bacteriocin-processing peptidase n=1 Tax=Anabaena cylindrica (strain ATCC 27899 / PCC 7122) TaxID=272123 RepID=K9ZPR7_ANACC|nr:MULTISPECIES: peptidase domain-containing ABC transporter [Anabaena]AFZ60340.1 bacteriocin-processing peptidase [Anabaena cylindrica PCC 7122]MBD2418934.1 peptidase domain-containing ABC transporter [Anabaena cylindrica FACHB-243]MBY5285053.1 peptidase domain-containing ABC transporter [Anabaena sp. CCAP 1446/1C]MBY5310899.1 peptidase domain-containing ABC transporter [Anabaena sp. CCAP 1446/1C]MCM2404525.1 peptidase domain-containing ABC transporter [Anabaena sp. CCAP 1446/1C]
MKLQFVKQHSVEDCGAACLAAIAKYYGHTFTLSRIREAVGTGQSGTTLLGLRRGAETLGFKANPVKTSVEMLDRMNEAPLPAIIHWKGNHWVVLYGKKGKNYLIADPAVGVRHLSKKDLIDGWKDWLILLLEPDPIRFFEQESDKVGGFWRFFKRVWIYRAILVQALPLNLVLGLLSLASPFLLQILTDDVLVRGDTKLLTTVAISVVVMNFISNSLSFVQSNLIAHFAQRLQLGLVLDFGRQILRLPLSYYEARRSGEIISRLQDIQQINQLVTQLVVSLPSRFFIALISLAFMLFYSWKLTIVALIISVVMTLSTIAFQPTLQQKTRELLVQDAENQGVLVETFKGALTLKTTTAAPQFWDELESRFGRLATLTYRTIQISIINNTFSGFVSAMGGVILLWFGGYLVIEPAENLSIGKLLAFNSMNGNYLGLIGTVISFVEEFTRAKTSVQRLTEVIDATPENENDGKKPFAKISDDSDIICTNVNFHYAGRIDLLEDFSLIIPGGQVVALIGKSGCGKSSFAKLIAGLYPLQSGNIRIGLYNLQDLSLECLRQQVVLVPQDAHFWSRSIVENFRLGAPYVTFEQIVRACQISGADEFISKLPEKYQTILGEFGANISGGQRQRLAIARAIVSEPPILILDESTGGLDPVSEEQVLDQLFKHRQGQTTILISHRPKVINRADWIILLNQGRLKMQGSLEELKTQAGEHLDFINP